MTRGADELPVSDHAVLRFLQRVCGVDVDRVRRHIYDETRLAVHEEAIGCKVDGIVYRLKGRYVTTVTVGDRRAVQRQHADAVKKILRKSRHVPVLSEDREGD